MQTASADEQWFYCASIFLMIEGIQRWDNQLLGVAICGSSVSVLGSGTYGSTLSARSFAQGQGQASTILLLFV